MKVDQIKRILEQHDNRQLLACGDLEQLRQKVLTMDPLKPMLEEIRHEAESALDDLTPELSYSIFRLFGETGERKKYEHAYFTRRKRLTTFGIALWLYPNRSDYHAALCDIIWAICDEFTWCLTAHLGGEPETSGTHNRSLEEPLGNEEQATIDLFSAETAFALAELSHLLSDALPPLIRKRMGDESLRRVLRPFANRKRVYQWEKAKHNWASVCAGSIGAAALYLIDGLDETAAVLEHVFPVLDSYLSGFAEDGACTEGYGYWEYGFGYYVYFADLMWTRTAGEIDLLAKDKVREIAMFQQKSFLDERYVVNFSDSSGQSGVFMGLSHYLHRRFEDVIAPPQQLQARFLDDHCSRWAPALRNLTWFDDKAKGEAWPDESYYLADAQWLISRHTAAKGRYAFAAKGGHNEEPHNHNDIGHFILHAEDTTFLADIGRGLYSRDYFGANRYDILCTASIGHSVPVVNGGVQLSGREHKATVVEVQTGMDVEAFSIDMAEAYNCDDLMRLKRTYTWRKSESPLLELRDDFVFCQSPASVTERFITPIRPKLTGNTVELWSVRAALTIIYDSDQLDASITDLEHIDQFGISVLFHAIDLNVIRPVQEQSITIRFEFH